MTSHAKMYLSLSTIFLRRAALIFNQGARVIDAIYKMSRININLTDHQSLRHTYVSKNSKQCARYKGQCFGEFPLLASSATLRRFWISQLSNSPQVLNCEKRQSTMNKQTIVNVCNRVRVIMIHSNDTEHRLRGGGSKQEQIIYRSDIKARFVRRPRDLSVWLRARWKCIKVPVPSTDRRSESVSRAKTTLRTTEISGKWNGWRYWPSSRLSASLW